jgi:hypothetical protein
VSAPSDPQLPSYPGSTGPARTQEIPVVRPAGATAADPPPPPPATPTPPTAPHPAPAGTGQPTGPVDGLPEPPPAVRPAPRQRTARDRRAVATLALAAVAVVLLELGLSLRFGTESLWSAVTLWSAFATACALLVLPGVAAARVGATARPAAGGVAGLAVFWLLVVLPGVASDRGFLLTAAPACLAAALWLGGRRG